MIIAFIFSSFALFAALGALWYTAEALRRVNARGEAMVKPYMGDMKGDVDQALRGMRAINQRLDAIERDLKWLKAQGANVATEDTQAIAARAAAASRGLAQPSVSLNG